MSSDYDQTVTLPDGRIVKRSSALWVPEWLALIPTVEYDKHFLYTNDTKNQPAYMCTCGSPAGVIPRGPSGRFQCLAFVNTGSHQS